VWWCGSELGWYDLPAQSDAHAIVGRHSCCDIVLPSDPSVALRHLLVRVTTLPDGTPVVRLLDLRTEAGFYLDDDIERRSVVGTGILAVRIGRYVLFALPWNAELPRTRPAPEILDGAHVPARRDGPGGMRTSVISLPPAPDLSDVARRSAAPGFARVTLRREDVGASVDLSGVALDAGVLVGRADRCESLLRRVLNESVSRVHLILLREHGFVHAFDAASAQGLFANGKRVRCMRLGDCPATLCLGAKDPVLFEWEAKRLDLSSGR
jgi:hypothetical protein